MITQVKVGHKYINVSVAIIDDDGNAIDPVSAEASFYKISQIDGSLSLDTNIGGSGIVTLTKQNSQTGFYGASIDIVTFLETEYVVFYKILANLVSTITVEYLSIDLSKKQIGEIKTDTTSIISTLSTLVADVWSYGTRTLTSFGTLVADIWNYVTRTITSGGITAAEVWTYITRTLTSGTKDSEIDAIKTQTDKIPRILGLSMENHRIFSPIYDANNCLTSATIKIYPTKADVLADTNAIATYAMVATFDADGKCLTYRMTKE